LRAFRLIIKKHFKTYPQKWIIRERQKLNYLAIQNKNLNGKKAKNKKDRETGFANKKNGEKTNIII
jgi:hypothetical protein